MNKNKFQIELSEALKSIEEINHFFAMSFPDSQFKPFIPLRIAYKIKELGLNSPLGLQYLPSKMEFDTAEGLIDPIGDRPYSKAGQIIHRYTNRLLFLPQAACPVHCRYCFRRNELTAHSPDFKETLNYLHDHPEINEIIFTGGDPFMLSDHKLKDYLLEFSRFSQIKFLRFHSRIATTIPSRITSELLADTILKYFPNTTIVSHINHPLEFDEEVAGAFRLIHQSGIRHLTQSVLLKGINDNTEILAELFLKIAQNHATPYYLHHPDQVLGAMHFFLDIETARRIIHPLHNLLPGWAVPKYMIDLPGGHGKIPGQNPESFHFTGQLLTKDGQIFRGISR